MDMTRQIQVAVVRADMFICSAVRWLTIILPSVAVLLLAVVMVKARGGGR